MEISDMRGAAVFSGDSTIACVGCVAGREASERLAGGLGKAQRDASAGKFVAAVDAGKGNGGNFLG